MRISSDRYQPAQSRKTTLQRRFDLLGWILPAAGLTLPPKCPVSLAIRIALVSGIGGFCTAAVSLKAFFVIGYVTIQFYIMYRISRRLYQTLQEHPQ